MDDDDDEKPIIRRRRGEADAVNFTFRSNNPDEDVALGIKGVAVRLGGRLVLQDASWMVRTGEKLALVGPNGCGKTTQLRVLTGELVPEEGSIFLSRPDLKMAVLSQGFVDELDNEKTLKDELLSVIPKEAEILRNLTEVQKELEGTTSTDPDILEGLQNRLIELQNDADAYRVYDIDDRLNSILNATGFVEGDEVLKVAIFSGGFKVRIGMAKIFMTRPDALLLDEPTNHLDLESVEWIEGFLKAQNLPIVVVSHDREFMNRVCTRTVETVEGMTYSYNGTYSDYIEAREKKIEQWQDKYEKQEKRVKELEEFIKVNRGKQALSRARDKKIEELERLKTSPDFLDPPPSYVKKIRFRFPMPPKEQRGGGKAETLAELRRATHGYPDDLRDGGVDKLFEEANFTVSPGEKIGIVGRNGTGKSTLLKLLMGKEKPLEGKVLTADPRTTGFFTQHQADLLPADKTAFEVVKEANEILMDDDGLMEILKKFRFRGDRANVKCENLSGGEKARLAIVRMMLIPSRMLVLDEPTNHLDIGMKETLELALREYEGAVVIVSHDRWFLSQTCRKIVAIQNRKVEHYEGDFRYYMDTNIELKKKIEKHYIKGAGVIQSVPLSLEERRAKERVGLRKNATKKLAEAKKESLQSMFVQKRY